MWTKATSVLVTSLVLCPAAVGWSEEPATAAPVTLPASGCALNALKTYYDSGAYMRVFRQVIDSARTYLISASRSAPKPALVLDIDETALSNYDEYAEVGFCREQMTWVGTEGNDRSVTLQPTLELYKLAKEMNVGVFFVTGRRERTRAATEAALRAAGYDQWAGLMMKADDYKGQVAAFKSAERDKITNKGYTIILNMGDQISDLDGGFARKTFLLPNPFYAIP